MSKAKKKAKKTVKAVKRKVVIPDDEWDELLEEADLPVDIPQPVVPVVPEPKVDRGGYNPLHTAIKGALVAGVTAAAGKALLGRHARRREDQAWEKLNNYYDNDWRAWLVPRPGGEPTEHHNFFEGAESDAAAGYAFLRHDSHQAWKNSILADFHAWQRRQPGPKGESDAMEIEMWPPQKGGSLTAAGQAFKHRNRRAKAIRPGVWKGLVMK